MLQRQIMFKQLEELQRQKKLQELNDSRQQNVINQQSLLLNKQASGAQYAPLINGTPVRDPSQMFMFGNTNLVQGFQNGLPYSQSGHGFSRFSNFHGTTREQPPIGEQQMDTVTRSSSMSDQFNAAYQEQGDFGGNIVDKTTDVNLNPQDFTSLDPLEQKFLFNTDDNNFGNMFEDTDNSQAFPSLQSGSWSALMQSALDETSSTDTAVQEEWSGLSFQNPELSNDNNNNNINNNQPSNIMESGKHPTSWFQNKTSNQNSNSNFPGFQQFPSTNFQFRSDSSHGSNQQSQKEGGDSSGMSAIVDKSSGFPVQDSNAQTSRHMLELLHKVDKFKEYKHGQQQSSYTESTQRKIPKAETTDAFTPSNNSSVQQSFGLRLSPPTQRHPANYFNSSQVVNSHLKNQDGQQGSNSNPKSQPNVWIDIPCSRMETASEGQNSQTFDYGQGQEGKFHPGEESFSGRLEANGSGSLKQSHISPHGYSPLNPTYSGPGVKKERLDSDHPKFPQVTSMSALTSAYENYKSVLASSAIKEDHLVKSPFYPPLQDPSQLHKNSSFVQMNLANTSQYGTNSVGVNQDSIISKSKKRKFPIYELLPWHKEATQGSRRLHDTSIMEVEWGEAGNRVPEQMKEGQGGESETLKRRIILTTQLMQVLFRPTPFKLLLDDALECYEMVTYFAARLALADACSFANHPHHISDTSAGKKVVSKGSGDENLSKVVEDFIDRSKKIEDVLLRLENGGSVLEIRMESQDLERFSVINRFAKFHSRAHMAAAPADTTTTTGVPKLYPQRYVAASPMPRVVPEGHNCLSL
ncbi:uncharacterized protein LOC111919466 [Lactuca sativa]|uniref:Uncharacterized protein n=1 Tax=Lactuca sativa TaxID=4236 RepID=A0A9R1VSQ6_LACSA|nr:uncharacterized protein LOC111919466 [Lactuca sativa]XP_052626627.1 uncharacterized protein LOC111919466 [Lactuca sativa]KAJ0211880.1 hypothetical protein LSAT_V11C400222750 [Lactuca sativa]